MPRSTRVVRRLLRRSSRQLRVGVGCGGGAANTAGPADVAGAGFRAGAASGAVDGEARGGGEPALAPTPTPDDVVPPDAGSPANALPETPGRGRGSP